MLTVIARRLSLVFAALVLLLLGGSSASALAATATPTHLAAATSSAAASSATFMPDPGQYCVDNAPYPMQSVDGWTAQFINVQGDMYTNDWKCVYAVSVVIPTWDTDGLGTGDENDFVFPPYIYHMPIDWNAMCSQQFPGSWAQWILAPEAGVWGAPWECVN
jgi:hypothetical protein